MLVNEPMVFQRDPIMALVASLNGNDPSAKELRTGVYETGHFGSSHWPSDEWEQYSEVDGVFAYGVCDTVDQLLARCPSLEADPNREFFVRVTPVLKANQEPSGGWRWHKWGEYIGTHTPQHEYLYDEEGIDGVLCFHIYERKKVAGGNQGAVEPAKAPSASAAQESISHSALGDAKERKA